MEPVRRPVTTIAPPAGGQVRAQRVPWQAKFLALSLIWGSSFLLIKLGLGSMAPVQISWLRVVTGAVVLLVLLAITRQRLVAWGPAWWHLSVSAFFLTALPFTLFALSEERIASSLAGIANATTPLASVVFGLLLVPATRLPAPKLVAVTVGLLGVVVIMQPWQLAQAPDPVGFATALVAGASYGLGWTYVKRTLGGADLGGLALPAAQLVSGSVQLSVILLGWWLANRDHLAAPWSVRPDAEGPLWPALLAVGVLGAIGTGLAQMLQFDVVRAAGPTVATTVTYLIPVVAVVLGVVFLDERLAWPQLLGAAIILAAAVVIGSAGRAGRHHREPARGPVGSASAE